VEFRQCTENVNPFASTNTFSGAAHVTYMHLELTSVTLCSISDCGM